MKYNLTNQLQKWVKQSPKSKAVYAKRWYTYEEFYSLVNKTAQFLKDLGYKKNQGVCLYLDQSLESMLLICASHQIGGFYIPFNKNIPVPLIKELKEKNKLEKIICLYQDMKHFDDSVEFSLDKIQILNEYSECTKGNYAYQIFTSGTTGLPKGVLVSIDNLDYIYKFIDQTFPSNPEDTLIWNTPYTFDVSAVEIFGWTLRGSKLAIQNPEDLKAYSNLAKFIYEHKVTHLNLSPTIFSTLIDFWSDNELKQLNETVKYFLIGGEAFPLDLAVESKKIFPKTTILNLYGPTEASVYATVYEVKGDEKELLPIGKALPGAQIKIIDESNEECIQGEVGEIFIQGEAVAVGYSNDLEKTSDKFPHIKNIRSYATGDFGRILKNGDIEFLGRKDRQVQVNGIRIDLSQIESRIEKSLGQRGKLKVIYHNKILHLFYLESGASEKEIEQACINVLSQFEQPKQYYSIAEFPMTPSRKLDEKKLGIIIDENFAKKKSKENSVEADKIVNIVIDAFKIDADDIAKKFEQLGIDSLRALVGLASIEKEFNIRLSDDAVMRGSSPLDIIKDIKSTLGVRDEQNIITESIDLLENLSVQIKHWKEIGVFLFKNSNTQKHQTYGLQKIYFFDNFESAINIRFKISKKFKKNDLKTSILKLIKNIQSFRLGLSEKNEKLEFKELEKYNFSFIPQISIPHNASNYEEGLKDIEKYLIATDKRIKQDSFLHTPVLVEFVDCYYVLWSISHMIADGSTVFQLKKMILDNIENEIDYRDYTEFINFIDQNTDEKRILSLNHTKELVKVGKAEGLLFKPNKFIEKDSVDIENSGDIINKISQLCFEISKKYSRKLSLESFSLSLILNLREFVGFDANLVLGDVHSTVVTHYNKNDNYQSFERKLKTIIEEHKNGNNPYQAAFRDFPNMTEEQKLLEKIYDTNPVVSLNYLGFIDDDNMEEELKNLEYTREVLSAFPATRIYLSAFETSRGEMFVFSLNDAHRDS